MPEQKPTNGIFITGTDTGVGKTYIGSRIIQQMRELGCSVTPRKPAESGCPLENEQLIPADGMALMSAAGRSDIDTITPFRFAPPLSPVRAAALSGEQLMLQALIHACTTDTGGYLVVEGAGGFLSPLAEDGLNADLASALGLPVLVVVADRLGCVNHCLLTLEAINNRGLDVAGIILNQIEPDVDDMNNQEEIERLSGLKIYTDSEIEPLARQMAFN